MSVATSRVTEPSITFRGVLPMKGGAPCRFLDGFPSLPFVFCPVYAHVYSIVLCLGSGESGKSTIVKQMKIIHQNGYTPEELLAFRPLIWKNLFESARDVVNALTKFNLEPITSTNRVRRRLVSFTTFSPFSYSGELRTYLGVSAHPRRSPFLLQPRHRTSRSRLMGG